VRRLVAHGRAFVASTSRAALFLLGSALVVLAAPSPAIAQGEETRPITIRTVPPLEGVRVELDGTEATTDASGVATIEVTDPRDTASRLVVLDEQVPLPTGDGHYQLSRLFGRSVELVLGYDTYREVGFTFVTLQGRKLALDEIDSLQLKNTLGGRYEDVDRSAPVLLHANRAVSSPGGPTIRDIVWSIDSVMVGTSNVVNRSEVRFTPATETDIVVTTLFFDAKMSVSDLFFGFATGRAVLVEDPNGVVTEYELDNGELELHDLPRGDYNVTVLGPGLKLPRPVALSRDQTLDLALLSYLDLAVAGIGLFSFVTGTFVIGLRRRGRQKRRTALTGLQAVEKRLQEIEAEHRAGCVDESDGPVPRLVSSLTSLVGRVDRAAADLSDDEHEPARDIERV